MIRGTILCVDDEQIVLKALKSQLIRGFGNEFNIEVAESATEAMEVINDLMTNGETIPLVITDQIMPEIRGDKFLQIIHQKQPQILKILITGQAELQDVSSAVNNANLYRFISKPWDETDLILTVDEAIKSFFKDKLLKEQNLVLKDLNANLELKVKKRTAELVLKNKVLEELHRERDGIIEIVAHDLRSPFNSISGISYLLENEGNLSDNQIFLLKKISELVTNGNNLISDLLIIGSAESNNFEMNKESINIIELVNSWLLTYQNELKRKEQNLTLDFEHQDIPILIDKSLLFRIFDNLFTNAIKFSPIGGTLKMKIWSEDEKLKISFSDSGPGISKEDQSKLFKKFSKLTARPTGGENSTGLGLSIVKILLNKIGGEIEFRSKKEMGSEFIVDLPK